MKNIVILLIPVFLFACSKRVHLDETVTVSERMSMFHVMNFLNRQEFIIEPRDSLSIDYSKFVGSKVSQPELGVVDTLVLIIYRGEQSLFYSAELEKGESEFTISSHTMKPLGPENLAFNSFESGDGVIIELTNKDLRERNAYGHLHLAIKVESEE